MYWGHMNGWGVAFMGIQMLLFWGLIIGGVVLVVRSLNSDRRQQTPDPSRAAAELLAHRYARGEIDDEEYERRLTNLRAHTHP